MESNHKDHYMDHGKGHGTHGQGNKPGNMNPDVEDYQAKSAAYAEHQAGKTTDYIARTNRRIDKQASDIKKQAYKGRYD